RKRPMPVGIEDFKKLIQREYYFVDKTRFIRDLLDLQTEITLITRPRRFGKTLTLSMLQYFFTLENAGENRELFRGLDIERAGEKYMQEQGTRPVVFLTLKEVRAGTFAEMRVILAEFLRNLYGQSQYLEHSEALSVQERQYFSAILNEACDMAKMKFALANLMKMMEKHHGRKPVLLLDEYDATILSAWEKGYYEECIDFRRGFLGSALKTNPSLYFAILTGVTRVSKESIFSGLNNLKVCSVLSEAYCDIFGFTRQEAARLMEECGVGDKLPELKRWYDGYRFGSAEIYNPWSVIRYIDEGCKFQPYWLNVSGNSILHVLLEHVDEDRRKELEGLMKEIPVEAVIDEGVIYSDIRESSNALYMMMLTTGYLKAVEVDWDPTGEELPCCKLLIPNKEIRMVYRKEILGWMATRSDSIQLRHMLRAMVSGDAATFRNRLQKILTGIVSYHDAANNPENFYHGLLLGFAVLMSGSYRVESNRESGYGRFDIAFFPLKDGAPGVILELKSAKSEEAMEEKAKEALRQIEEKSYITELSQQGAGEVWKYGISFHGKRLWLEQGK
ncbi:MAG: AAA family ATPase, partial [Selenomonadaceae bacterium]|nr:AAA family ATPase [Selenomonadaceae bacterium]